MIKNTRTIFNCFHHSFLELSTTVSVWNFGLGDYVDLEWYLNQYCQWET